MQGARSASEICEAIEMLNLEGRSDVIILARGGGSLEDLWSFNEEVVARAIFGSKIPVVSGVGHDTDVTISDLAADFRAPTPSAAAELVVPDIDNLRSDLDNYRNRVTQNLSNMLSLNTYRLQAISENLSRAIPQLNEHRRLIDEIYQRLFDQYDLNIRNNRKNIETFANQLRVLDFNSILARGFAYIQNASNGSPIRSSKELDEEDIITLTFNDGDKSAQIL